MIGDWVKFPIGNEKIIDLPYIPGKGICASFAASATLFPVEVEKLQPIPLTAEILEKNGWIWEDKDALYLYLKINGCKVVECLPHISDTAIHCVLAYRNTRLRITLRFVHELQHALRLCGIEHEITL